MITVYHNPKCRKSRAGLEYLTSRNIPVQVVEYLKHPLNRELLKDLLMRLNMKPHDIVRTQEDIYKEQFKGKAFNDDEWITILLENPKLIQRPIMVKGPKAIIGQDADEIEKLLVKFDTFEENNSLT